MSDKKFDMVDYATRVFTGKSASSPAMNTASPGQMVMGAVEVAQKRLAEKGAQPVGNMIGEFPAMNTASPTDENDPFKRRWSKEADMLESWSRLGSATSGEAALEQAVDAEYPIPDSPHNSVLQRAAHNRLAFGRGYRAALAASAEQSNSAVAIVRRSDMGISVDLLDRSLPDGARLFSSSVAEQSNTPVPRVGGNTKPDAQKVEITREGRMFWHTNCSVNHFKSGVMRVVSNEPERSLIQCQHCDKYGYYQVGGAGTVCADEVQVAAPVAERAAAPASVPRLYEAALTAVETMRGCAASYIEEHRRDTYPGQVGLRPQDVAEMWAAEIREIDAKAFLDEAIADQLAAPEVAQPAAQGEDLEARNKVAAALGLPTNGLRDGKPVSFGWPYLLGIIEELATPAPTAAKGDAE